MSIVFVSFFKSSLQKVKETVVHRNKSSCTDWKLDYMTQNFTFKYPYLIKNVILDSQDRHGHASDRDGVASRRRLYTIFLVLTLRIKLTFQYQATNNLQPNVQ